MREHWKICEGFIKPQPNKELKMQDLNQIPKPVDFPELEKLVVRVKGSDGAGTPFLIVAGANFDIGLTLVNAADPEHEVVCLSHKEHCKDTLSWSPRKYTDLFYAVIAQLQKGYIDIDEAEAQVPSFTTTFLSGMAPCAFR